MKKFIQIIILIIISSNFLYSQKVGLFNTNISFYGEQRNISIYVPETYDSTQSYNLIVGLHGLGDNCNNYSSALINSLKWKVFIPNTIFIFPDGGSDQNKDFYSPMNDIEIVDSSISYILSNYKINTNEIILQGFSLGGRSALKYGLDNPTKFKGLLLNTPAIQGLQDTYNKIYEDTFFDYSNAKHLPIYILCGDVDYVYVTTIEKTLEQLKLNNAILKYVQVPNIGHTIPNETYIIKGMQFINQPLAETDKTELFLIDLPMQLCANSIDGNLYIRNIGNTDITDLKYNIEINNTITEHSAKVNIKPFEHFVLPINLKELPEGMNTIKIKVTQNNETKSDTLLPENNIETDLSVELNGMKMPISEDFENSQSIIHNYYSGSIFGWYIDEQNSAHQGKKSISAFNTILLFVTIGDIEYFTLPTIDLTKEETPTLSFDYAFNYTKYTPPYTSEDMFFTDTLEIEISTDCGNTYQSIFKKYGKDLATYAEPIINPLNLQNIYINPTTDNWKRINLDLSQFKDEQNAIFKFNYISGMGGNILLDNISIAGTSSIGNEISTLQFEIYPNPSSSYINIDLKEMNISQNIIIYNTFGQTLITQKAETNTQRINIEQLPKGIYYIKIGDKVEKFLKM